MADFLRRLLRNLTGLGTVDAGVPGEAPMLVHWLDVTPRDSKDKPCELRSLEVEAHVRGVFAEVTQTLVIHNPNPRNLSTQVSIPLPDRATVCGYALDIDGQMVDGVVVPKEKARVVFEAEQRRGADPGIVEQVRGNAYRTRVYPVPPRGERTVRLRYVTPLHFDADGAATLELPMPVDRLERRTVTIEVERLGAVAPTVSGLSGEGISVTEVGWGVSSNEKNVTPAGPVRISLPELPASLTLLERDTDGSVWFCASDKAPAPSHADAPAITSLTVLWDASGSRASQDHTRELELLRAYASAETIRSITLVVFADRVREVIGLSSADELCAHLAGVRYDGGTNFAELTRELALMEPTLACARLGGACVLFTDGLDTLSDETFALPHNRDVAAILSGQERDVEAMRQGCKGVAFEVSLAPGDAAELMGALCDGGSLGLWGLSGHGIADTCDATTLGSGRRIVIGRLTGDEATLSLTKGGEPLELRAEDARAGTLLATAWASRRVTLLSPRADENAEELLKLGRRFGVASPATSLIVLESLDQWLRHDIEPPRSLASMHEAWERAQAGKMLLSSGESSKEQHRQRLARSWAEYLSWWKRDREAQVDPFGRLLFGTTSPDDAFGGEAFGGEAFADMVEADGQLDMMLAETGAPEWQERHRPLDEVGMPERPARRRSLERSAMPAPQMRMAMPANASRMGDMAPQAEAAGPSQADEAGPSQAEPSMSIAVKAWMPDAPYLKALDEAASATAPSAACDAYFAQRSTYLTSPSFFLDCAGWFMAHGDADFGVSVLTNLAEMRIEDAAVLRVMAWRLREAGRLEQALVTLRRVRRLRPEDSQSHRDLALVLTELARAAYSAGDEAAAKSYAEEAGELLRTTALTPWSRRAMAIGLITVEEYNVLRAWAAGLAWAEAPNLPSLGEDLEGVPDCDLRITLAWDADETDVDIHVTEPSGEEAYYAHRLTSSGGRVSEDITDGFGPEQYEIRTAREGTYLIRAHYYASHQQTVFGPATCTLTVYTDWGRANQDQTITTTRLDHAKEMTQVGTASYGACAREDGDAGEDAVQPERTLELGMTEEQVRQIMGEPSETLIQGSESGSIWELAGGRNLLVWYQDGLVVRVVESMPWGDQMVIAE